MFVTPALFCTVELLLVQLEEFVIVGGILVCSFLSFVSDVHSLRHGMFSVFFSSAFVCVFFVFVSSVFASCFFVSVVFIFGLFLFLVFVCFLCALSFASCFVFSFLSPVLLFVLFFLFFFVVFFCFFLVRFLLVCCVFSSLLSLSVSFFLVVFLVLFSFAVSVFFFFPLLVAAVFAAGFLLFFLLSPWSPPAYMLSFFGRFFGGSLFLFPPLSPHLSSPSLFPPLLPILSSVPFVSFLLLSPSYLFPLFFFSDSVFLLSCLCCFVVSLFCVVYLVHLSARPFVPVLRCSLGFVSAILLLLWSVVVWLRLAVGCFLAFSVSVVCCLLVCPVCFILVFVVFFGVVLGIWYFAPRIVPLSFADVFVCPGCVRFCGLVSRTTKIPLYRNLIVLYKGISVYSFSFN